MAARERHEELWSMLPEGIEPQHFELRRRFLLEAVRPGMRALDLGAGEGWFAAEMVRSGASVVAADVAHEPLRRARQRVPGLDARLIAPEGRWQLEDASFDLVWAGEVIEHVADPAPWLSEVRRVLRAGGELLLSTPSLGPAALVRAALSRREFARIFDPRGEHVRFYSRDTLSRLLEDFRFEQVAVRARGGAPGGRRVLLARAVRSRW